VKKVTEIGVSPITVEMRRVGHSIKKKKRRETRKYNFCFFENGKSFGLGRISTKMGRSHLSARILLDCQNSESGTFWCPPSSFQDLGYVIPARVRPSDSKAVDAELRPKHKDEGRSRHLFTGEMHHWNRR
jgi:hypothetical protein